MKSYLKKILIVLLVFIDQTTKLIVSAFFLNHNLPIIKGYISFSPIHNDKYSYLGALLNYNFGKALNSIIAVIAILLIYYVYKFALIKGRNSKLVNLSYVLLLSGTVCSLIDRIFWSGSLDYIWLHGFFTFDLKDALLSLGAATAVLEIIIYSKQNSKKILKIGIREDMIFAKEFGSFVKQDVMKRLNMNNRDL